MPGERLPMRKIREVLRLRLGHGLSQRAIGQSLRLSVGAVNTCLRRARVAGLNWPLPDGLDDTQLEALLYPPPPHVGTEQRPVPDWSVVHRELRRPNMTLALLWEEYRAGPGQQDGFGYSWFCDLYREWAGRLKPTLRQVHIAGEKLFVDFAGQTMEVIDGITGEIHCAQIFVAVLGASSFIYAEATASQSLPDWIAAHVHALSALGGVPRQLVSDNLKAGITKACFYEPTVNRTYADMAAHYRTAIIPARPYKPRDKAKVEVGVQVVQRWILTRLRNRRFFSLAELNQAIRDLVAQLNDRPMRGWGTTRRALFEQLDRPALLALPPTPYEYADWKRCRVNLDYHIEIEKHFYSVPFRLLRQEVEARITAQTVEIFHRGNLVATHLRSPRPHRPSTVADHMPSSHRRYRDWTHERIQREAAAIGDDTAALVEIILRSRPHPEQGFRSCIGILGLPKRYGVDRLNAACAKALRLGTRSYSSVAAILKNKQDSKPARQQETEETAQSSLMHENIRGPGYYH
jgi:transposase